MKAAHLLFLILITNIFGCENQDSAPLKQDKPALNIYELGNYNKPGNILISVVFDECGEWGGHFEKIRIYTDSSMTVHAKYVVYPFKCDSFRYYYNTKSLKPTLDTTVALDNQKQKSVAEYVSRLSQAKLDEKFPGNAGKVFLVTKSDSTLFIQVNSSSQKNDSSYNKLLSELF